MSEPLATHQRVRGKHAKLPNQRSRVCRSHPTNIRSKVIEIGAQGLPIVLGINADEDELRRRGSVRRADCKRTPQRREGCGAYVGTNGCSRCKRVTRCQRNAAAGRADQRAPVPSATLWDSGRLRSGWQLAMAPACRATCAVATITASGRPNPYQGDSRDIRRGRWTLAARAAPATTPPHSARSRRQSRAAAPRGRRCRPQLPTRGTTHDRCATAPP